MSIQGWYYLHQNGDMIYKVNHAGTAADIRESDFARCMWPLDPSDRAGAWDIAIEGLALGASRARVMELASKWGLNDIDADEYARRAGISLDLDGNAWCATGPGFENLQEGLAGFGETKLEAMANLAKALGIGPGKMWRQTFRERLSVMTSEAA